MRVYSNSQQKPQTLSIRHLPEIEFELLNNYMQAFLEGDIERAQKALERLDSPRLPNEKTKPGNLLIMGEPENDNLKNNSI